MSLYVRTGLYILMATFYSIIAESIFDGANNSTTVLVVYILQ